MPALVSEKVYAATSLAQSTTVKVIDLTYIKGVALAATYSNTTPSAKTFVAADVDLTENTVSEAAHGFVTGTKVQLSSTGTLPAGLATSTDYFIIRVSASLVKFAASLVNAVAGTAVDITDTGSGGATHTITATTAAGNTLKLQGSIDGSNYEDLASETVTIATTAGTKLFNLTDKFFPFVKVLYTPSAGQASIELWMSYELRG